MLFHYKYFFLPRMTFLLTVRGNFEISGRSTLETAEMKRNAFKKLYAKLLIIENVIIDATKTHIPALFVL